MGTPSEDPAEPVTLAGGTVIDGTGRDAYTGNVTIENGIITAVSGPERRGQVIDVSGCVVAPGFIDVHSHVDWQLGYDDGRALLAASLEQGITTAVVGNCGISPAPLPAGADLGLIDRMPLAAEVSDLVPWGWQSMAEYLLAVERDGIPLNIATFVGHNTLRCVTMHDPRQTASRREIAHMRRLLDRSIDEGALGLSVGLEYFPGRYAAPSEVASLASVVAGKGAILAAHTRGISHLYGEGMDEILAAAESAGCKLQVSHVNPMGKPNWPSFGPFREAVGEARGRGCDVGYDAVTYVAWTATVADILPHVVAERGAEALVALASQPAGRSALRRDIEHVLPASPSWRPGAVTRNLASDMGWDHIVIAEPGSQRFADYTGASIAEVAARRGVDATDCYFDWLADSRGAGRALLEGFAGDFSDESPLEQILREPDAIPETDTAVTRSSSGAVELTLPLFYGTMPRFIGHFGRDRELFTVEAAVSRMTASAARRMGIGDRGVLRPGYRGDVTVFDPSTISDQGSYLAPQRPRGIEYVLVGGDIVVREGRADVGRRSGEVVRSKNASRRY